MPVYEYQCNHCSKTFELFLQNRALVDDVVCRHCHSPKVRKLVSSFASVGHDEGSDYSAGESCGGGGCGGCSGGNCGSCSH
jgi:putative FmdB family regulatory protein